MTHVKKRTSSFLLLTLILILPHTTGCRRGSSESGAGTAIQNVGSDTMVNLALAWAEAYTAQHPEVGLAVTGGGSGTGIAGLINGTVDIANASRSIKTEEVDAAESNGVTPVQHVVARDAIAVVVHPSNPVDELTINQLSDIYQGHITNWREVGGPDRPIVLLSRESNSGTHVYFLEQVVRQGNKEDDSLFSRDTLLLPSSYVLPAAESVNNGAYPIARDLYMYTPAEPTGIIAAYLDWLRNDEAQAIVKELGFVPLK
jgi:phosphate transport system substrate-binding protein